MTKIIIIFLGLFVCSCSNTKEIIGTYHGKNYFGLSELILKKNERFTFKIDRAMMSDSVGGYYKIHNKKIKLISTTKNVEVIEIEKFKSKLPNEIEMTFVNPDFLRDTIYVNDEKILVDPFYNNITTVNCDDQLVYKTDNFLLKIDSIKCGFSYKFMLYRRDLHKIIPDTFDIRIKNNKFDFQNFTLKKIKSQ